jgi:hypothetical protein
MRKRNRTAEIIERIVTALAMVWLIWSFMLLAVMLS